MSKRLDEHTEQELLFELLTRQQAKPGPFRVSWSVPMKVRLFPIGRDHTISIYFAEDDLEALKLVVAEQRAKFDYDRNR